MRVLMLCDGYRSVRLPGRSRDSLLLAFADARLSVIDYDPARNTIVTTSLHTYDDLRLEVQPYIACASWDFFHRVHV